jgi:hypothetical protein
MAEPVARLVERIEKKDVKKFIIKHSYGEKAWCWPRGIGGTIVLSTVEIYCTTSFEDYTRTMMAVYKNGVHPNHAEGYFIKDLRDKINTLLKDKATKVNKIQAKLVQNYSPCNNYSDDHNSGCADDILKFIKDMEQKDIIFSLTIKFANFYLHTTESNREGLKKLLRNVDIELKLLQGEDDWEAFLNDENFVELTNDEYKELLERATSEERTNRETKDVEILDEITAEEAKGRQEAIKQYSHIVN